MNAGTAHGHSLACVDFIVGPDGAEDASGFEDRDFIQFFESFTDVGRRELFSSFPVERNGYSYSADGHRSDSFAPSR